MELVERLRSIAAYGCELSAASTITEAADLLEEALKALAKARDAANELEISSAHFPRAEINAILTKSQGEKIDG